MDPQDYMSFIRAEGERMAAVAAASFGLPVPTCPGWDVADLLTHTGWVHRRMAYRVGFPEGETPTEEHFRAAGVPEAGSTQRPQGVDLVPWFEEGVTTLLLAFSEAPATKLLRSALWGTHPPSLLMRRVAHETAIHRWDAEAAVGSPEGFDPALAADGIDELLEVWVPRTFKHAEFGGTGQRIQLQGTGGEGGWVITVNPETTEWRRGHDEGADVTAQGDLSDLYLLVWNRHSADRLDVLGDKDVLTRWQAAAAV